MATYILLALHLAAYLFVGLVAYTMVAPRKYQALAFALCLVLGPVIFVGLLVKDVWENRNK